MPSNKTELKATLIKVLLHPVSMFINGLVVGMFIFGGSAEARDRTTVTNNTYSNGIALGIATAQHHFDFGTHSWQGSVGVGNYDNDNAVSFGLGKRFDRMLINGSVGNEDGKTSLGAGVNWRF